MMVLCEWGRLRNGGKRGGEHANLPVGPPDWIVGRYRSPPWSQFGQGASRLNVAIKDNVNTQERGGKPLP